MENNEMKEVHFILDQHVNTETWDIPNDVEAHGPLAGCSGGRLECGICGKTYSWKDWAHVYSYGAMTRMGTHLVRKHGLALAKSGHSPAVSRIYIGVYGRSWMDERFRDV